MFVRKESRDLSRHIPSWQPFSVPRPLPSSPLVTEHDQKGGPHSLNRLCHPSLATPLHSVSLPLVTLHAALLTASLCVTVAGGDVPLDDKAMCRVMWFYVEIMCLLVTLNLFTRVAPHTALLMASLRVMVAGGDIPIDGKVMCCVVWSCENQVQSITF